MKKEYEFSKTEIENHFRDEKVVMDVTRRLLKKTIERGEGKEKKMGAKGLFKYVCRAEKRDLTVPFLLYLTKRGGKQLIWKAMAHGDWREAAAKKGVMKGCFPARVWAGFCGGRISRRPGGVNYAGGHVGGHAVLAL